MGIGSAGAGADSHLQVLRDIYYIATEWNSGGMVDYDYGDGPPPGDLLQYLQSHPQQRFVEFPPLKKGPGEDQFFMCGDNSSNSQDSRLWVMDARRLGKSGSEFYVTRDLLIGKAFFLYWPHSWDEIPTPWGSKVPCFIPTPLGRFPIVPDFRKMRLVREPLPWGRLPTCRNRAGV